MFSSTTQLVLNIIAFQQLWNLFIFAVPNAEVIVVIAVVQVPRYEVGTYVSSILYLVFCRTRTCYVSLSLVNNLENLFFSVLTGFGNVYALHTFEPEK